MSTNLPYIIEADELTRGESFRNVYEIQDTSGVAIDISAASVTVYLRLRRKGDGGAPVWDLSGRVSGEGEFVTDGTDGQVRFTRTPAQTDALPSGKYVLEILYEDTSTDPDTYRLWGRQELRVKDPGTGDYV